MEPQEANTITDGKIADVLGDVPAAWSAQAANLIGGGATRTAAFALLYRGAGLSPIRVHANGSKVPTETAWSRCCAAPADEGAVRQWFASGGNYGIGIACGRASGNLAVLDFETNASYTKWLRELPPRLDKLTRRCPLVRTGGGGAHLYVRLAEPVASTKLARHIVNGAPKTLIEVKGDGGMVIAPGSPGATHPTGNVYEWLRPGWLDGSAAEPVTLADWQKLIDAAHDLNEVPPEPEGERLPRQPRPDRAPGDVSPGDDFDRRGTLEEAGLFDAGWKWERQYEHDRGKLTRPGKAHGVSATFGIVTNKAGVPLFYCFTSNGGPFAENSAHSLFGVYARLKHNGNFSAAATALMALGYGTPGGGGGGGKCAPIVGTANVQQTPAAVAAGARPDPFDPGIGLAALMSSEIAPPRFVFDGIITEGLSVLAGRPKQGKSWLAMLASVALHRGRDCLGARCGRARPVLYLALEDTRRRFRDRTAKTLAAVGTTPGENMTVFTTYPRASKGGLQRIGEWFAENRGGLVVVDTLAKFRDPSTGRGTSYDADYEAVASLKTLADTYEGAALLLHHTRKGAADDPFDEVSGTLGINGAADSILVLDRHRGANSAALYATGRDLPETTFTLTWDAERACWEHAGRVEGIERPERGSAPNKEDRCAQFLAGVLRGAAWPDDELLAAAKRNGFTLDNVKSAKAKLRKSDPRLYSKARGFGGVWWNWLGQETLRDRTDAERAALLGDTPETPHTEGMPE